MSRPRADGLGTHHVLVMNDSISVSDGFEVVPLRPSGPTQRFNRRRIEWDASLAGLGAAAGGAFGKAGVLVGGGLALIVARLTYSSGTD